MTGDETFTDAKASAGEWVDVRMTNPEAGEWEVDMVVVDGQVQYVDLRVRAELLASFVDCLVDDVPETHAQGLLERIAAIHGIEFDELAAE